MSEENLEFLRRKWRHFATVLDYNKTGEVSVEDHKDMAERAIRVAGLEPNSLQAAQMKDKLIKTFYELYGSWNDGKPVDYDKVVNTYEHHYNGEALRRLVYQDMNAFFDLIDFNGDGVIQLVEFRKFYYVFALSEEEANKVFLMIDKDGNGTLERDEFTNFGVDFFFSSDETCTSRNFFGLLRF